MSLQDKFNSAKPTTFLTDGLSEEEVKQAVDEGRRRMSDTIKLIIEIPKDIYDGLINNRGVVIPSYWHEYVADLCKNGTPLPKEHGRLIDADVLVDGMEDDYEFCEAINATPTIIEADKAESEDT